MEKIAKNPFVGGHDHFENQYNVFCRHRHFENFLFDNFFEKSNIFQNNDEKLFWGGTTIFDGTGRCTVQ